MKKKLLNEEFVIKKYLTKLSFNKKCTYNFQNDGSYIKLNKNLNLIVTNDSLIENIDFFKGDNPKSIAQKIVTINLSDLSAMGSNPYSYTLNMCIPDYVNNNWFNIFSNHLLYLQHKYNFFLIGGDLSSSKNLMISSTFFGIPKSKKIIPQNKPKLNDDIWVTGFLGNSLAGFKIIKKQSKIFLNKKLKNHFLKKYYFPKPCMIGAKIGNYSNSAKDISDGFFGDLNKMLGSKFGAEINLNLIPLSDNLKKLLKLNILTLDEILSWGDDYELIFFSPKINEKKIKEIANKSRIKVTKVGKIINKTGIYSNYGIIKSFKYFDHFV